MKKSLRSVDKRNDGRYEYFRVSEEEAKKLVEDELCVYISREEYKRQSTFYHVIPCTGTIVNTKDKDGNVTQKSLYNINYTKYMGEQKYPTSTKLGKGSKNSNQVRRKNKFGIKKTVKTIINTAVETDITI